MRDAQLHGGELANGLRVRVTETDADEWPEMDHIVVRTPLLSISLQDGESADDFAERVTNDVARLSRLHVAVGRLSLTVEDDASGAVSRAELLCSLALHLIDTSSSLTIRFPPSEFPPSVEE